MSRNEQTGVCALVARLGRLTPSDTNALEDIRRAVSDLCSDLEVEPYARFSIGEANRALSDLLAGTAASPDAALKEARAFLAEAAGEALPEAAAEPCVRIRPAGDLVGEVAIGLKDEFCDALNDHDAPITLDLSGAETLDAAGLAVVLGLFRSCTARGRPLALEGARADVLQTFQRLGIAGRLFDASGLPAYGLPLKELT